MKIYIVYAYDGIRTDLQGFSDKQKALSLISELNYNKLQNKIKQKAISDDHGFWYKCTKKPRRKDLPIHPGGKCSKIQIELWKNQCDDIILNNTKIMEKFNIKSNSILKEIKSKWDRISEFISTDDLPDSVYPSHFKL